MKGRSLVISALTLGMVAASLLVPGAADARPAGVVVKISKVTVTPPHVHVAFNLKGAAMVQLVVKSAGGYRFVATQQRKHTGRGAITWNRTVNGRPAARGTYTVTVVARAGTARSQSSSTVDLE
jgi:hypothetical protein